MLAMGSGFPDGPHVCPVQTIDQAHREVQLFNTA